MSSWQQISRWGIQKGGSRAGDNAAAYAAGKLDDVLRIQDPTQNILLVASASSGVWKVDPDGGAALSLSHDWQQAGMNSLARGVFGPLHVYAGGESLMETDTTDPDPIRNWIPVSDSPGSTVLKDAGVVNAIAVIHHPQFGNIIVLACVNGVIFSKIPSAAGGAYQFVTTTFPAVAFGSVVQGPDLSVVAATFQKTPSSGIYQGVWLNSTATGLSLTASLAQLPTWYDPAQTIPFDPTIMGRISVDSCGNVRSQVYAVVENTANGNFLLCVLKSDASSNGPLKFSMTGTSVLNEDKPLFSLTPALATLSGNNGFYNQSIGVSPTDPDSVVFGWRNGYFFSGNGGDSWTMAPQDGNAADILNYHGDYHATRFDLFDSSQRTLYICSDGGLNITKNFGQSNVEVSTLANRRLPNLLVTQSGINATDSGNCSCSLQDNGGVGTTLYPLDSKPYVVNMDFEISGNDGRAMVMLPNDQVLYTAGSGVSSPVSMIWDAVAGKDLTLSSQASTAGVLPLDTSPPDPQGLTSLAILDTAARILVDQKVLIPICSIPASNYKNPAGEAMIALAVASTNVNSSTGQVITPGNWIYGLFVKQDSNFATNSGHWTPLNKIALSGAEEITAVGTFDGTAVVVGTSNGRILALQSSPTLPWSPKFVTDMTPTGTLHRIVGFAFDALASAIAITDSTTIWQLTQTTNADGITSIAWTILPPPGDWNSSNAAYTGATAITFHRNSTGHPAYFISTYTDVFMRAQSVEPGFRWTNLKTTQTGLPEWPRCMDVSAVSEDTGAEYVYVSTYGFGVWRSLLNSPDTTPTDVFINGTVGINVGNDAGSFLITPQKFALDALNPYAEFEVVNQLASLSAQLFVFMRLRPGGQVEVKSRVIFRFDGGNDPRSVPPFTLVPNSATGSGKKSTNAEYGSGSDAMDVDFDVSI
jgi:hypothetical protein